MASTDQIQPLTGGPVNSKGALPIFNKTRERICFGHLFIEYYIFNKLFQTEFMLPSSSLLLVKASEFLLALNSGLKVMHRIEINGVQM